MNPRLRHIAQHAGVSEATVSRVANNKPGVAETTRRRVLEAIAEFRYQAPGLGGADRAGLVGLIIPELSNPIFPMFAQAIAGMLANQRFTTVLCTATIDGVSEDEYVDMLLDRGMAGLVVVSGQNADMLSDHTLYRRLADRRMPMVFMNGAVTGVEAPVVSSDDAQAADLAVRHLVSLGHTSIGCIVGPRRYVPVQRRLRGHAAVCRELGLEQHVADGMYSVEGGEAATRQLLDRPESSGVTAIVAASDLMALGAIRALRAVGKRVPNDVSVVGYDDNPLLAFTDPPLTSVRQPLAAMSEAAARALIEVIEGDEWPRQELTFHGELIVRGSTAVLRT